MKYSSRICIGCFIICAIFCGCSHRDYEERQSPVLPYSTSIFVGTDRHETGSGNNLTALLQAVSDNPHSRFPRLILLGGDYVGQGPDVGEDGQPVFNVTEVNDDIIKTFRRIPRYDLLLTYGSHDKGAVNGYSAFFSGPRACDGYYIYGISFAQMKYSTDSEILSVDPVYDGLDMGDHYGFSAEKAAKNFYSWVRRLPDNEPIIIMSHLPIHANRKDNNGAYTWYKAISEAAKSHDILLLFGHNHTLEERGNPTDAYHYLLAPGDSISIQGVDSVYREKLNFSYANAGYIKLGYSTVITLTDYDCDSRYDDMTLRRFSLSGENDCFGLTGKKNPYRIHLKVSNNYSVRIRQQ